MTHVLDLTPSPGRTAPTAERKLLIGGRAIATRITGKQGDKESGSDKKRDKTVRWLYGQVGKLPIWQLEEGGTLYAFEDELIEHFESKAAEAKAARIAAAEAKATEKAAIADAAAAAAKGSRAPSRRPTRHPAPTAQRVRPRRRAPSERNAVTREPAET
jgi:hypothetical protein